CGTARGGVAGSGAGRVVVMGKRSRTREGGPSAYPRRSHRRRPDARHRTVARILGLRPRPAFRRPSMRLPCMDAITAEGLVKVYRTRKREDRAHHGIDLTVDEGTVLALLGPNGAGKTTTVRILATLLRP